jgi:hypothetical protein
MLPKMSNGRVSRLIAHHTTTSAFRGTAALPAPFSGDGPEKSNFQAEVRIVAHDRPVLHGQAFTLAHRATGRTAACWTSPLRRQEPLIGRRGTNPRSCRRHCSRRLDRLQSDCSSGSPARSCPQASRCRVPSPVCQADQLERPRAGCRRDRAVPDIAVVVHPEDE